jgi:translation initiation factor IF-3
MAKSQDMDLVLFNIDNNDIAICKIMKYEKYIYELNKANKRKKIEVKEIKIGPNISDNDLNYRINHIDEFIKKGHKVKLTMEFRGREMKYIENGNALFLNLLVKIEEVAVPEFLPKIEGKKLYTMLRPKTK